MHTVRFYAFDARAALVMIILFFRLTDPFAWLLVFMTFMFFRFLERKGLTFPAALRNFRMWIVGKDRPGLPGVLNRKFKDFG